MILRGGRLLCLLRRCEGFLGLGRGWGKGGKGEGVVVPNGAGGMRRLKGLLGWGGIFFIEHDTTLPVESKVLYTSYLLFPFRSRHCGR